jgi:hypothetical protein
MSLILKYKYISLKLCKICLNPINSFKEIWLLTTYGLKILQALVTQRIVHIGTFSDGPHNTFIKSRNTWLQNLTASVAVIWLMEMVKSFYLYHVLSAFKFGFVLAAVCKSEVTEVQKFKFVQKSIHLATGLDIKKQWHFYTFEIFEHELQTSDQSVQLPATDCLIPVTVIMTILYTLHLIHLWSLSRFICNAY